MSQGFDPYHRFHQQTPPPPPCGAGEGFRLCQGSISNLRHGSEPLYSGARMRGCDEAIASPRRLVASSHPRILASSPHCKAETWHLKPCLNLNSCDNHTQTRDAAPQRRASECGGGMTMPVRMAILTGNSTCCRGSDAGHCAMEFFLNPCVLPGHCAKNGQG